VRRRRASVADRCGRAEPARSARRRHRSPAPWPPLCWVGPRRGVNLSAGPFPRPALRTGRASSSASGSPQAQVMRARQWRSLPMASCRGSDPCSGCS
jgi:hypothetical protein